MADSSEEHHITVLLPKNLGPDERLAWAKQEIQRLGVRARFATYVRRCAALGWGQFHASQQVAWSPEFHCDT